MTKQSKATIRQARKAKQSRRSYERGEGKALDWSRVKRAASGDLFRNFKR